MSTGTGSRLRIGVDIGGTFTDFVLLGNLPTDWVIGKRLTTPDDPSHAVIAGLQEILAGAARRPEDIEVVIHATTLVTNTVIERTGARVGLITTKGFRDVLDIGNELRYDIYDLFLRKPEPLVPRYLRKTVDERVDARGEVIAALSHQSARTAIQALLDDGVEALAVCLLHSYANPIHEAAILETIRSIDATVPVTLSSTLLPEIREYERTLATVINAYVQPKVVNYTAKLSKRLAEIGVEAPLYIMQSSGGLTTADIAATAPIAINESGPAAGALYASAIGSRAGLDRLVSFDMGGTTAKTCLIQNSRPSISVELEFARLERFKKGSGFPIRVPTVELIEIGAGGGSIAWIDEMGLLKVGPRSAGSSPGPACYGLGGSHPTVTDADLLLGFLDPHFFLGGDMRLQASAAERAITEQIATPLGISPIEAAWGIHEIVNENMALASRIHIVERGEDPRGFSIVAFGGAGPVHAQGMASKLGASRVIFPVAAGAASAFGLLVAAPLAEFVQTYLRRFGQVDWKTVEEIYGQMEEKGHENLRGLHSDSWEAERSMDVRYAGQGYEISVPVPSKIKAGSAEEIADSFRSHYERLFGRSMPDSPMDIVNLRVRIRGNSANNAAALDWDAQGRPHEWKDPRKVYFGSADGFLVSNVYNRYGLRPGTAGQGPAIIEERESTVVVGPHQDWHVDPNGSIVIDL